MSLLVLAGSQRIEPGGRQAVAGLVPSDEEGTHEYLPVPADRHEAAEIPLNLADLAETSNR